MPFHRLSILCSALAALVVLPISTAAAEPAAAPTPPVAFLPNSVIVEWTAGTAAEEKVEAREGAEVRYRANLGDPAFQLVKVEPGQTTSAAIDELEADPAVAVAERDALRAPTSIPDDPLFGQLWGLQNSGSGIDGFQGATAGADIDALGAWGHTVGTPSTVVADIDTGYRFDDPDLGPVAWKNPGEIPGNGKDDDHNGFVDDVHGYDFVGSEADNPSQDDDPTDDNLISGGHGLHTAGTIGAAGNNGVGITGVAQDVRLMPLRVCANSEASGNEARCPTSSIIAAINYAGANGARVANLSLSGTSSSTIELDAFAENPQTLFVIAAGNDGMDNDSAHHYPCDYEPADSGIGGAIDNIVCVAATNQADELASFSDWSPDTVDLGAPGTEILSTYPAMETPIAEDFEQEDFATKWIATGANGGFARTNEAPLTSFGISDSPGSAPAAESGRSSTLGNPVAVPAGDGACQFSGRDSVALDSGIFSLIIFKNGFSAYTFQLPSTNASQMASFTTVPMTDLAGSNVGVRVRYIAGPSPTASSGVWLDDLKLTCYAPDNSPLAYEYLQGTSMAAPHVTGAAALLFSLKPTATVDEVREALLSSVDHVPSLTGKTATGGRLDATKALAHLDPPAPLLTSTDPASPANDWYPNIVGSAEPGSTIKIFEGSVCAGAPAAVGTAEALSSPGIMVTVKAETTATFSAKATDTASKTSSCSLPISYTNIATIGPSSVIVTVPPPNPQPQSPLQTSAPPASCTVPKLAGKTQQQAASALAAAGCTLGKVTKPKARRGHRLPSLVVKSSSPAAGAAASGAVNLTLGPKPKKQHH